MMYNNRLWSRPRLPAFADVKKSPTLLLLHLLIFISLLFLAPWIRRRKYDPVIAVENKSSPIPDCVTWNHTGICPKIHPAFSPAKARSGSSCPVYFRWIHEDLRHWRDTGITEKMVSEARRTAHFRLTILGGKMYVEKFKEAYQSRVLFTLWGFAQLMRRYGGKLPDLELMFDCDDLPVVKAEQYTAEGAAPPPLFRYSADKSTFDIVSPDWTFWGW